MKKKIFLGLLIFLVVIQFIRPSKNMATGPQENSLYGTKLVPDAIYNIMNRSCNDCHSNNTTYPWYSNIQPVGWFLQYHVNEGKSHLNFDEFGGYPADKAAHKLEEMGEQLEKGEMPLSSYTLIHKDAILTLDEKEALISWSKNLGERLR